MITLTHASRWYGQVIGLNDVSCEIRPGLTALLGPNGAGKSTLLKLITGQLRPTTGALTVLGESPFANRKVLARLGYCPEIDNFYEDMTGREFVRYLASLNGFSGAELTRRVNDAIERVGMTDRCDRKVAGYSKGMRQRIKVAQGIVHEPDVLVLDEPLNGLDPVGRRDMSDLMHEYASKGRCVLVSSHILYEVEALTENILLMQRGRLLAQGSIHGLRDLMDKHPHHVAVTVDRPRDLARDLLTLPSVLALHFDKRDANRLEIETHAPESFYQQLSDAILTGNYQLEQFTAPDNNLEALLRYLLAETGMGNDL